MCRLLLTLAIPATLGLLLPVVSHADICSMVPHNLLANCGFETGDFTGWTISGNTGFTFVSDSFPNSGTYSAMLGPIGSDGFLSQTFNDVAGAVYTIGAYVASDGGIPNDFAIEWNGTTLLNLPNIPSDAYTLYTATAVGTGHDTVSFGYRDDPGYIYLDDTFVAVPPAIPEPGYWAVIPVVLVALFVARKRRDAHV
jgi:hypothetical protein